jgi:hypothetical protein
MASTSEVVRKTTKRARNGGVKLESGALEPVQAQPFEPRSPDFAPPAASAWDPHVIHTRAEKITKAIKEFSQFFLVSGDNAPVVLHFSITDWVDAFEKKLVDLGLDEDSAHQQVDATLVYSLAKWAKTVAATSTAQALNIDERWLVKPSVTEAARIGYLEDEQKSIDKIFRAINNLR